MTTQPLTRPFLNTINERRFGDCLTFCALFTVGTICTVAIEAWAIYKYDITKKDCGAPILTNYSSVACVNMNNAAVTMIALPAIFGAVACLAIGAAAITYRRSSSYPSIA